MRNTHPAWQLQDTLPVGPSEAEGRVRDTVGDPSNTASARQCVKSLRICPRLVSREGLHRRVGLKCQPRLCLSPFANTDLLARLLSAPKLTDFTVDNCYRSRIFTAVGFLPNTQPVKFGEFGQPE
jgi:hypothetical protein